MKFFFLYCSSSKSERWNGVSAVPGTACDREKMKMVSSGFHNNNRLPPCGPERAPFHVLYAGDEYLNYIFHPLVLRALGANREIFPVWASSEQEVRIFWTHKQFHCVFLVLNNIIIPGWHFNAKKRIREILALITRLRDRSPATIIAFSGLFYPGIKEEALHSGADWLFPLPFPYLEVVDLLRNRFGSPESGYEAKA